MSKGLLRDVVGFALLVDLLFLAMVLFSMSSEATVEGRDFGALAIGAVSAVILKSAHRKLG